MLDQKANFGARLRNMRDTLNQAAALSAKGDIKAAAQLYRQVLEKDPKNASAFWGLGRIAMGAGKFRDAISLFEKAISFLPSHPFPLIDIARAHEALREFDIAGKYFRKAAKVAPDNASAQYTLAVHLNEAGAFSEAEERLRASIDIDPVNAFAFYELSKLKTFTSQEDGDFEAIKRLLVQPILTLTDETAAHFALGKAYDDIGDQDSAFENFSKANAIQYAQASFSVSDMRPYFEDVKQVFNAAFFETCEPMAPPPITPIFIVGMPRTGSSLLEIILGRHSDIFAGGEMPFLGRNVVGTLSRDTNKSFPHACIGLHSHDCQRLAQIYYDAVSFGASQSSHVTDKLPANFQSIGLIRKIMPEAKIINLRRSPMDTGFSIFRNFFNENEPYFCDLGEIGEYYKIYDDLMAHWRHELPGFILDIDYESLVADSKSVISGVLEFCGLEWQDACLASKNQSDYVRTMSARQVRQGVSAKSIGYWRDYEKHLEPLRRALS